MKIGNLTKVLLVATLAGAIPVGGTAYASLPATISTNTAYGDVLGPCGYAIKLGQFGGSGYVQAVNFGSGSGCSSFNSTLRRISGRVPSMPPHRRAYGNKPIIRGSGRRQ